MDSESMKMTGSQSLVSEPEEGEIFDVSYNPIERPVATEAVVDGGQLLNIAPSIHGQDGNVTSSKVESETSASSAAASSEDDDTDELISSSSGGSSRAKNSKRLKMGPQRKLGLIGAAATMMETDTVAAAATKSKNRNIWTTIATEDSLNNSLVNCDVGETFDRSRNVEAYDYRLSYSYRNAPAADRKSSSDGDDSTKSGELDAAVAVAVAERPNPAKSKRNPKRKFVSGRALTKQKNVFGRRDLPRVLANGIDSSPEQLAAEIAKNLTESKSTLVGHVVRIAGHRAAIDFYMKVCDIERDGGMSKEFGRKRRTSGGVYFFLVKNDDSLTAEQKKEIFSEDQTINMKAKRKRRRQREFDTQQEQNGQGVVMAVDNDQQSIAIENNQITLDLDCDTDAALTKDICLD